MPVPGTTRPVPKGVNKLLINEHAFPCPSHARHVDGVVTEADVPRQHLFRGPFLVHQGPALVCEIFGQQSLHRYTSVGGVRDVLEGVGVGQPHSFYKVMVGIRGLRPHVPQIKPFPNIQRHQYGYSVAIWRALPACHSPVVCGDRLDPGRCVSSHILGGQPTSLLLDERTYLNRQALPRKKPEGHPRR